MPKTVADPRARQELVARFARLTPAHERRWGTLTPHEMLCHLGDAFEMALGVRPRPNRVRTRVRPLFKAVFLWSAVRWPHGIRTNPSHDPRAEGTRPGAFDADRARLVAGMNALATAAPGSLEPVHGIFGAMTVRDWQRWAWKHADHHLRQFGL
jgi:hypothetical protein